MNSQKTIRTKTIKAKPITDVVIPEVKASSNNVLKEIQVRRKELASLAERVANDNFFYVNYYFEGGKSFFPQEPDLQKVKRFFPYAEGGPLFVDEPMLEAEEKACELKKEAMKKLGHRYLVIKRTMNLLNCLEELA